MKEYFEGYGYLEWLEPEQYYAEPWIYHGSTTACGMEDSGELYAIVINKDTDEFRYTII